MVYQYVFEEGLEMSLVPEKEASPFVSGPKILELGLTEFTGRLIITQQALRQYILDERYNNGMRAQDGKDDYLLDDSPYSFNDQRKMRQQRQQQHPTTTSGPAKSASPSRDFDTPGYSSSGTLPRHNKSRRTNQQAERSNSRQKPPVPSVKARKRPHHHASSNSNPIDEVARAFLSPDATNKPAATSINNAANMSVDSSSVEVVSVASTVSTRKVAAEEALDELAEAFQILSGPAITPGPRTKKKIMASAGVVGDIDETSAISGSQQSQSTSSYQRKSTNNKKGNQNRNPRSEFSEAFATVSDAREGNSIDDERSKAPSLASSSASSSSSGDSSHSRRRINSHLDPLQEYAAAFVAFSGEPDSKQLAEMIDDVSSSKEAASSAGASTASAGTSTMQQSLNSTLSSTGGRHIAASTQDPISEYADAYFAGTLTVVDELKAGDMIDEESNSNSHSQSHSQSSAPPSSSAESTDQPSMSQQSLDPLTKFTNAYNADPPTPESGSEEQDDSHNVLDESNENSQRKTPKASNEQHRKGPKKKRHNTSTQHAKAKKTTKAGTGSATTLSADKKQKIRDMFPNYPDVGVGLHGSLDPVGVYLHKKLSAPFDKTLTPKDLRELLEVFPFAAYCADDKGRLPLHTLGENSRMVRDPSGRMRATTLAKILIQAYPESITYPDSDGMLPFVALLQQWISECYAAEVAEKLASSKRSALNPGTLIKKSFLLIPKAVSGVSSKRNVMEDPLIAPNQVSYQQISFDKFFPSVELLPYVDWCMHMLSMLLDDMLGKGVLKASYGAKSYEEQMKARASYVATVMESVPYLIKTVLFLDSGVESARVRIIQTPFFRRALICKESVGTWIQSMVKKKGIPSKLAIDYFQMLSQTSPEDFVGPSRSLDEEDVEQFHAAREKVYKKIEQLELIIPSLVILSDKETERAATTNVE